MTATTTGRIAVLATPFGFGPASKAYSIGQELTLRHGLDVRYFGSASALDFFAAQDVAAEAVPDSLAGLVAGCDAVVNVLAPELIPTPEVAAHTHYVDSLGFMWQDADVPPQSMLRHVRGYYAQDLFGSADNISRLGISSVTPVSGIVAEAAVPQPRDPGGRPCAVVNLGGLVNPAGTGSARAYLPLVRRLLDELSAGPHELTVAMNGAVGGFDGPVPARQLSGADFRASVAASDVVYSSPGMTTLVEVSQAGTPYVPLPPQNWSQVVIIQHMAARSDLAVWSFLAEPYRGIDEAAEEMHKAAAVCRINQGLAADAGFAAVYGELALTAAAAAEAPAVGAPFNGAGQVASAVAADLGIEGLEV